jgi:two-component system response regulator YesN
MLMPLMSGMEVLKQIKEINPKAIVVVMTSVASRENVMESKKSGAFAYLLKPLDTKKIERVVNDIKEKFDQERNEPS